MFNENKQLALVCTKGREMSFDLHQLSVQAKSVLKRSVPARVVLLYQKMTW
jgi:hypothetical protein